METSLSQLTSEISEMDVRSLNFEELIRTIGTRLNCEWAVFWKLDQERVRLLPAVVWSRDLSAVKRLKQHTKNRELSISEGNAGLVWRNQKSIWTSNLEIEMCFPRSMDAKAAGLTCGIWFPIKTSHTIFGVIELLGITLPTSTVELLDSIDTLGIRIGELLELS